MSYVHDLRQLSKGADVTQDRTSTAKLQFPLSESATGRILASSCSSVVRIIRISMHVQHFHHILCRSWNFFVISTSRGQCWVNGAWTEKTCGSNRAVWFLIAAATVPTGPSCLGTGSQSGYSSGNGCQEYKWKCCCSSRDGHEFTMKMCFLTMQASSERLGINL